MNTKVIPTEIPIDDKTAQLVITNQFNINVHSINKSMNEGWNNTVYLINGNLIFRFPKRHKAISLIEREIKILPWLRSQVHLMIPYPIFVGKPSLSFQAPFIGYEVIKGRTGSQVSLNNQAYETLAYDLGKFLKELHQIKLNTFLSSKMSPVFDRMDFHLTQRTFTERMKYCSQYYNLGLYHKKIKEIIANAKYYSLEKYIPSLVHGDIYHRHLIFNEQNQLVGLIDWGEISIANPIADLGIVYQFLIPPMRSIFFAAYGKIDEDAKNYARYIGLYYAIALLWFGHDRKDIELINTSIKTLDQI